MRNSRLDRYVEDSLAASNFSYRQHEVYRRLRETSPVYWSPTLESWLVTSFELVDEVLTDPRRFTSVGAEKAHLQTAPGTSQIIDRHFSSPQLNISDPPDHTRIRRAFGRSFLPREIAGYESTIRETAGTLLDNALGYDQLDLVASYAEPLPVEVVSELIGIPHSLRERIPPVTLGQRHFFGESPPSTTTTQTFDDALSEWREQLVSLLDERATRPRADVLTRAAQAMGEEKITQDEAIATCLHLVIAGNGTTTALIGNTVFLLLTHPDQFERIQQDHSLIANAVEESLRFESPLPGDRRIATTGTTLGGIEIEEGDRVLAVLASANRDEEQFLKPDSFDASRVFTANQHAAFGRGVHFCLGAPVARLETRIAIEELLDRIPNPRLSTDFTPEWHSISTHRGLVNLPIDTTLALT